MSPEKRMTVSKSWFDGLSLKRSSISLVAYPQLNKYEKHLKNFLLKIQKTKSVLLEQSYTLVRKKICTFQVT